MDLVFLSYFILFYLVLVYFKKKIKRNMILYVTVIQVTKYDKCVTHVAGWSYYVTVTVTKSYNTEKIVECSRIDDII